MTIEERIESSENEDLQLQIDLYNALYYAMIEFRRFYLASGHTGWAIFEADNPDLVRIRKLLVAYRMLGSGARTGADIGADVRSSTPLATHKIEIIHEGNRTVIYI